MNHDIIKAVTDFIFLADKPEKSDVIFLPGGDCGWGGHRRGDQCGPLKIIGGKEL